jgi:hypothetical protein
MSIDALADLLEDATEKLRTWSRGDIRQALGIQEGLVLLSEVIKGHWAQL